MEKSPPEFVLENPFETNEDETPGRVHEKQVVRSTSREITSVAASLDLKPELMFSKLMEIFEFL